MAYINELGQTVSCTVTNSKKLTILLQNWWEIILPLALLICGYFLLRKYVKNKNILINYIIVSILIMVLWVLFSWWRIMCA